MAQREWVEKDFYKELGVSSDASAKEIKGAYRKLASELHPRQEPGRRRSIQGRVRGVQRAVRRGQAQGVRRNPKAVRQAVASAAAGSAAVAAATSVDSVATVPSSI